MDIRPSLPEFRALARKHRVVPVWGEVVADLETPVSAFMKLDDGRTSFLFESVEGEERLARYSFLGSRPRLLISAHGPSLRITHRPGTPRERVEERLATPDPLREMERLMQRYQGPTIAGLPRFYGGLVGYLGYNVVRHLERIPEHRVDDLKIPDLMLMLTQTIVIFDHVQHRMLLVANALLEDARSPEAAYREAVSQIRQLAQQLNRPLARFRGHVPFKRYVSPEAKVRSNLSKAEFLKMVERSKAFIRSGDVIQVVLSQRFQRQTRSSPLDLYRALRSLNPSPYMYLLRFGGLSLVGSSPEMLVRCEEGVIETRPIAGTRRRGATSAEDDRLAQQMRRSPKERAEHLMLVDLGRNDLGRVAAIGSVTTPELMVVERYSHVMHLVSGVCARLKPGRSAFDVLRAAFPAGTVSGAPKVRAMEIIAELERHQRGTYAGAVGYISFTGNLDTCITIRTILLKGRTAYVQAGAGIVADSQPAREYQETINKAKGCLAAIDLADHGRL